MRIRHGGLFWYYAMSKKHSMVGTRLYRVWSNMKTRCTNQKSDKYKWYGARGISLDPAWYKFETFMKWAFSNGYTDDMELDRIDNNGNYTASNCRWVSHKDQCRNRSSNHYVFLDGEIMLLTDASRIVGKYHQTLLYHLKRKSEVVIDADGKAHTLEEAGKP